MDKVAKTEENIVKFYDKVVKEKIEDITHGIQKFIDEQDLNPEESLQFYSIILATMGATIFTLGVTIEKVLTGDAKTGIEILTDELRNSNLDAKKLLEFVPLSNEDFQGIKIQKRGNYPEERKES